MGAALALLGVLLPGVLAILVLGILYFTYRLSPGLDAAFRGMGAAVASFLCVITIRMGKEAFRGGRGAVWIAAITFVAVGLARLNAFLVILVVGCLGLWVNRPRPEAGEAPDAQEAEG